MKIKKADIILLAVILVLALAVFFVGTGADGGDTVIVKRGGDVVYTGSLSSDTKIEVEGDYKNTVIVKDGAVWVEDSTCPGHDCVKMGKLTRKSGRIACVPNGVIVYISGNAGEGGVDAVAG